MNKNIETKNRSMDFEVGKDNCKIHVSLAKSNQRLRMKFWLNLAPKRENNKMVKEKRD